MIWSQQQHATQPPPRTLFRITPGGLCTVLVPKYFGSAESGVTSYTERQMDAWESPFYVIIHSIASSLISTAPLSGSCVKMSSAVLFSCEYPIYTAGLLRDAEFYVAGGGGQAKTGVPNALVSGGIRSANLHA